jgi:hypothetical protein
MRRMNETRRARRYAGLGERGATTVFVAVSIIGLLAMTAFSFDFGRAYVERRELQVGAEAGALAIARNCAEGGCVGGYDAEAEADEYADANARDGAARIQSLDLDMGAQRVHVITGTEDTEGGTVFDMIFAGVVGFDEMTVGAEATAVWGPPGKLTAMPLIYSECEWEWYGGGTFVDESPTGNLHYSSAVRDGLLPPATGYAYEDRVVTIFFHGSNGICHYSPSGQDLPGGFGWLDGGSFCEIEVETGVWAPIDPGASPANGCEPVMFEDMIGHVQLIPYFDGYDGTGSNALYKVSGFGAFYITGYNFGGQFKEPSIVDGQLPCNGSNRCIEGYFIGDWVASGGSAIGGGNNRGVNIVGLTG